MCGDAKTRIMKKKIATVPRLVEANNGDWYVYFSVCNPETGKMVPQKIYKGFSDLPTLAKKRAWGTSLVNELTEKLKAGWTPLDDRERIIYSDQTEYHNLTVRFKTTLSTSKNTRYFISEYLLTRKTGLKPKSYSTYQSKLRIYAEWLDKSRFGDYDVSAIDNKIILMFFDFLIMESKLDKLTIEKYEQILRDYYNFLKKKGKVSVNPVIDIVKPPKSKDMAARPINDSDMKELLTVIKDSNPQLYLACMFQYYLAIRPGQELRLLKVKDIDIYNNRVVVIDETAKTSRRTIDMPMALAELCNTYQIHHYHPDNYIFGQNGIPGPAPLGHNTMRNRFNKFRDDLKFPKIYKYYSMKHTGGGKLLDAGLSLEEIRDHFGHRSIETTDHYVKRHFGNRNKRIIHNFPAPI